MSNQPTPETKKISTVLDKSSRAIETAASNLSKVTAELSSSVDALVKQQQTLAQDIEFKSRELKELDSQTADAVRSAAIELSFRVRENEEQVRVELVKKAGLVTVTQAQLTELEEDTAMAIAKAQQTEFEAVKVAKAALTTTYETKLYAIEAEHKVELAELNAQAKSDKTTIELLKGQVKSLEETITAEREAGIEKAKAAAGAQGVVVNTSR